MSYTKQTWNNGDVITAEKLNHMEDGIGGGGALIVHEDGQTHTLDKTWQEIYDADLAIIVSKFNDEFGVDANWYLIQLAEYIEGVYSVTARTVLSETPKFYDTDNANGYPVVRITTPSDPKPGGFS